jgi:hypothetical protein
MLIAVIPLLTIAFRVAPLRKMCWPPWSESLITVSGFRGGSGRRASS